MAVSMSRLAGFAVVMVAMGSIANRADAACSITTSGVIFGSYDVFATTPLVSTGTISVTCTKKEKNFSIYLSPGSSLTYVSRSMRGPGTDVLKYNLFTQPYTPIWGNGNGGTGFFNHPTDPGTVVVNVTVYGRVPAGQDVPAGDYRDTVVATVNF